MEKTHGYGHKRDMLVGKLGGAPVSVTTACDALIIGGGIAGCTLARALAERGCRVTLLERGAIAGGASGNLAAVLFPQLTKRWTASTEWYFCAYGFMLRQLARWKKQGLDFAFAQSGMLRLPRHAEEEIALRMLQQNLGLDTSTVQWMERAQASAQAGVELATGGAWFPQGTWLSPGALCRALLQHENIMLREFHPVESLQRRDGKWCTATASGEEFSAQHAIVCGAQNSAKLLSEYGLKMGLSAGQVSIVSADEIAAPLQAILCHKGYLIPQGGGALIGATYDHQDFSGAVTAENHQRNFEEAQTILPGWLKKLPGEGRTSFRATTPDRLPYIGALAAGLYVSTGHGSRGMLSAPLGAEMIAAKIMGEPSPVTRALRALVDPLRRR